MAPWTAPADGRRRELDQLLQANRRLNMAYLLEKQFDHVWDYKTELGMWTAIWVWRRLLRWKRLMPLNRFAKMLMRYMGGILSWTRHRLPNAPLEGHNAHIRAQSLRAGGYRNADSLMVMLFHAAWLFTLDGGSPERAIRAFFS